MILLMISKTHKFLCFMALFAAPAMRANDDVAQVFDAMLARYATFESYQAAFEVHSESSTGVQLISKGSTAQSDGFMHTNIDGVETIVADGLRVVANHNDRRIEVSQTQIRNADAQQQLSAFRTAIKEGSLTFENVAVSGDVFRFDVVVEQGQRATFAVDHATNSLLEYAYQIKDPAEGVTVYRVRYSQVTFDAKGISKAFHWKRMVRQNGDRFGLTSDFKTYTLTTKNK